MAEINTFGPKNRKFSCLASNMITHSWLKVWKSGFLKSCIRVISRTCRSRFWIFYLQTILEFFMFHFSLCYFITFFPRSLQRRHWKYQKSPTTCSRYGFVITFNVNKKAYSAKPRHVGLHKICEILKFSFLMFHW